MPHNWQYSSHFVSSRMIVRVPHSGHTSGSSKMSMSNSSVDVPVSL
ncbi:MAG: hypothetical protein IJF83_05600 [Methanobrevibacter sp.]|nr:hypothetical protein [Methanobrevibacter sp.]